MRNQSPMLAYDELDLAVADMHNRFLSIGERITELLRTLAAHLDARANPSIRDAAEQIADTQQRLKAQMGRLPAQPEERYQLMHSLLQAQQGALKQLSLIVEQHAGPGTTVWANGPEEQEWPTVPGTASGRALAEAHFDRLPSEEYAPHAQPVPFARSRGRPASPVTSRHPRRRRGGLLHLISIRVLFLFAVIGAVGLAYLYFPSDLLRHIPKTSAVAKPQDRQTVTPDPAEQKHAAAETGATESGTRRLPPGLIVTLPRDQERPAEATERDPLSFQRIAPTQRAPSTIELRVEPKEDPAQDRTAALKPAAEAETSAAEPAPIRFVAVVSTHRDKDAALDAFADLQSRYPGVLGQRKAEAQPIEIGDKGTWHRVVILPSGPRTSASGVCDQLYAAGFDRCWVKPY